MENATNAIWKYQLLIVSRNLLQGLQSDVVSFPFNGVSSGTKPCRDVMMWHFINIYQVVIYADIHTTC